VRDHTSLYIHMPAEVTQTCNTYHKPSRVSRAALTSEFVLQMIVVSLSFRKVRRLVEWSPQPNRGEMRYLPSHKKISRHFMWYKILLSLLGTQCVCMCVECPTNLFPHAQLLRNTSIEEIQHPPPFQRRLLNNHPTNAKSGSYRLWGRPKWTAYKASSLPSTPAWDIRAEPHLGRRPKPTNHGRNHGISRFWSPPQPNEPTNPSPHPLLQS
jgi:hypothetical protein